MHVELFCQSTGERHSGLYPLAQFKINCLTETSSIWRAVLQSKWTAYPVGTPGQPPRLAHTEGETWDFIQRKQFKITQERECDIFLHQNACASTNSQVEDLHNNTPKTPPPGSTSRPKWYDALIMTPKKAHSPAQTLSCQQAVNGAPNTPRCSSVCLFFLVRSQGTPTAERWRLGTPSPESYIANKAAT